MHALELFPPTIEAALARIAAVRPADYSQTRNHLTGAVTRLSPYITHGFVSLPDVLARVRAQHPVHAQHKFVFELGWREYFHHVWEHRGDGILHSLHEGPLPDAIYATEVPADVRHGCTGVPVIDRAVRELYTTGYLHNHARMWVASYLVHLRKVHWRAGADWMISHLLDGDLASNHLSWQWVAGTGSKTPYLFNAENIARFAPAGWHSEGTVLDTSYEALGAIARSAIASSATINSAIADGDERVQGHQMDAGILEPPLMSRGEACAAPDAALVHGRDVWLVHPWLLGEAPADLPEHCVHVGWWPAEHHAAWPWNPARWRFVSTRMAAITTAQWYCSKTELMQALRTARSVQTVSDMHVGVLPPHVVQRKPERIFAPVDQVCMSFSSWWKKATRGVA